MKGSLDWAFQRILEKKRDEFGADNYVCLAMGDELWRHDPRKIVKAMAAEGATFAHADSMQFFLHKTDQQDWDFKTNRWKSIKHPIDRLRWYSPGWEEARLFYDDGKVKYKDRQGFEVLPEGARGKRFSRNFVLCHYPLRDPVQVLKRAKDRVERDYQPFYRHSYEKPIDDTFMLVFPGMQRTMYFDGIFDQEAGKEDLL